MALGKRLEREWAWGRVTNLIWDTLIGACLQDMQMVLSTMPSSLELRRVHC